MQLIPILYTSLLKKNAHAEEDDDAIADECITAVPPSSLWLGKV